VVFRVVEVVLVDLVGEEDERVPRTEARELLHRGGVEEHAGGVAGVDDEGFGSGAFGLCEGVRQSISW
jgi:hypothetical protein